MEYRIEKMRVVNPTPIKLRGKRILFVADNFEITFNVLLNEYAQNKIDNITLEYIQEKQKN